MTVEIHKITSREQWLELRTQDVTAGDAAAVCRAKLPYKSPLAVYGEKIGLLQPTAENDIMRRGRWFEHAAIAALKDTFKGWEVRPADVYVRDPALRIGATPDAVAVNPEREGFGNIQIKTVADRVFRDKWHDEHGELIAPLYYQIQSLVEAKLMGASWASVVALVVGEFTAELQMVEVPLNDRAWQRVIDDVQHFWWRVANNQPPDAEPATDNDTLRRLYSRDDGPDPIDLSKHNQLPELLSERKAQNVTIKNSENRIDQINTEIMAIMKDSPLGTLPGWKVTWKLQHRKEYTVAATSMRVLRVTEQKPKG